MEKEFDTFKERAARRFFARSDMSAYGLAEPAREDLFWKKGVLLAATYPNINTHRHSMA